MFRSALAASLLLVVGFTNAQDAPPRSPRATTHVILVTIDGLRWQEVFTGPTTG